MSAEEKPIDAQKSVSWDWTAFWKEHQLLLNCVLSKCLPELQNGYKLFGSKILQNNHIIYDLKEGYIIYDGKEKSVHIRHGIKTSILAFCKKHSVPTKGNRSLQKQGILQEEGLNPDFTAALWYFKAEEIQKEIQLQKVMNSDIKHVEWSSVELDILNAHSGQKSLRLLWERLKEAERCYPDNRTIVWKLRFLKQHFSYLKNDPSLLKKGWLAYQQGILTQVRLQIEFLEKNLHTGTEFGQKLKEFRDSEKFAQIAVWGKLIDQMSIDVLREQSDDSEWEALQEIMKEFVLEHQRIPTQKEVGDIFVRRYGNSQYMGTTLGRIAKDLSTYNKAEKDQRSRNRSRFLERWGFSWLKKTRIK